MYSVTSVGAAMGAEAYLIATPQKTALIDTGYAYCGRELVRNLEAALHRRPLDCIILTHTHYDHCSGCVYCCERWPGAKVIAGTYAARVFSRPGALATIRRLNEIAARERGVPYPDPEKLLSLHVDETVSDGDVIDLGDLSFTVLETPGHTRCSIALYCPREAFLVSSETLGLFTGTPHLVMPCFLTGYAASVRSVRRVLPLPVTAILFPHLGLRRGEEIRGFFATPWCALSRRRTPCWRPTAPADGETI